MSDTVYEQVNKGAQHPNEPRRRSVYSTSGVLMGTKIEIMKQAVNKYLDDCNAVTNYVGLASFPEACYESPTGLHSRIRDLIKDLTPNGSTPMGAAMGYVLDNEPVTHGVIISDGCADGPDECIQIAHEYKAKAIKLDCVHIGDDTGGEETLKEIASITGGIYVKFSDMDSFRKNFQYLAPAKRSLLTAKGAAGAKLLLGAGDVKF
jgi:Mg-chelatase subunit ChlD